MCLAFIGGSTAAVLFSLNPSDAPVSETNTATTNTTTDRITNMVTPVAFLYQTVGRMVNGVGENAVAIGSSEDGLVVSSYGLNALTWNITVDKSEKYHYGDPVFSRLADGSWTMTAWSGPADPRGAAYLLYHESGCPLVDDDAVIAIGPSSAVGCAEVRGISMGKSSQVFDGPAGHYVFHMIGGEIYLAHLSDATQSAKDLDAMCVLAEPVTSISELDYSESTKIIGGADTQSLLLSDAAMAKRADGTWVLFVKGISQDSGCEPLSICELCARNIYRTTSTDLINWTSLKLVVEQASVPEATTMPDGTVRLYWQDFDQACATQDNIIAGMVSISTAYELPDSFALSEPEQVSFPDEAFQTDSTMHYATNGNPIMLPDATAFAELEACLSI